MYLIFMCVCLHEFHVCMLVPWEARRGCEILWNGSCRPFVSSRNWTLILYKSGKCSSLSHLSNDLPSPIPILFSKPLSQGFYRTWMEQDREEPSRIPFKCLPLFCFLLSWESLVFNSNSCSMIWPRVVTYTLGKSGTTFAPLYHRMKPWT